MMEMTGVFRAESARAALRLVREKLGEEAVIVSNRQVGDQVEIVAAIPEALTGVGRGSGAVLEKEGLLLEIQRLNENLKSQLALLNGQGPGSKRQIQIQRSLVKMGLSVALAEKILEKMPDGVGLSWVIQILERNLRSLSGDREIVERGGVVALVGPTGVGKTTTTAKLAARAVIRYGADRVGLITTDSYRIGAHEQLRIYGKILGVPVETVRDGSDLRTTLAGLQDKHLILIDTMGIGQRDDRVPEQKRQLESIGARSLLLLNATSNLHTLEDVVRVYRSPALMGCIPTKLDEAMAMGGVLDVAIRHHLPFLYLANGQRVPEDLHEVDIPHLLNCTFSSLETVACEGVENLIDPGTQASWGACAR